MDRKPSSRFNGHSSRGGGSDSSDSDRRVQNRHVTERERDDERDYRARDGRKREKYGESSDKGKEQGERERERKDGRRRGSERREERREREEDERNGRGERERERKRGDETKRKEQDDGCQSSGEDERRFERGRHGQEKERSRRDEVSDSSDLEGRKRDMRRRSERRDGGDSRRSSDEDEKWTRRDKSKQYDGSQSSGEDEKRLERGRHRQEKERSRRDEESDPSDLDGRKRNTRRKSEHRDRRYSRRSSDEDEKWTRRDKSEHKRERSRRHEDVDSRRHRDDDHRRKDRHKSLKDNDEKVERHRDRNVEDRNRKARSEVEDWEVRTTTYKEDRKEAHQSREDRRDKKLEEPAKPPQQSAMAAENPGGNLASLGRTGGVYIPPYKLARMMKEVEDKSSVEYQRLTWDALRKSINGLVNKVNATNIKNIIPELFSENLIRGRGLFCRSCMKSQMASPNFTDVFAALVSVVNTKFPEVGYLLLRRIVLQLKRAYKRNDKPQLLAAVKFIAHLVNQQVAHELVALELLTILLEQPTDDSVEVAVDFVKECGSILQDLSPKGLHGIFERFRGILHEGEIDKRVQFLIEGLFAIRKAKFQGFPAVRPELDLVEPEDQFTHEISLDDEIDPETTLDIFRADPNFLENEKSYEELKKNILGEESENEEGSDSGSDEDEDEDEDEEDEEDEDDDQAMQIKDETETNLVNLRRTIYLTIMSSVDFEEAGHKLLKIKLEPGQEMELCIMLLECCSQERTYLRYYGLLGQRFCMVNKVYQENFEKCFVQQYSMIHRLETNKLRNVAKFFAHLLGTDALPWHVLAYIRLTEEDTTSSSRIFIKILFQELSEHLGIRLLNEKLNDPTMLESFESIFPRDNPRNTRFSINFFTSIGLGGITENLREYLKNMPRLIMQQQKPAYESSSGSGSDSGSSGSESESDSSSSDDSGRDDDRRRKRRKR